MGTSISVDKNLSYMKLFCKPNYNEILLKVITVYPYIAHYLYLISLQNEFISIFQWLLWFFLEGSPPSKKEKGVLSTSTWQHVPDYFWLTIILHDKSYMAFLFINQGTYYAAPHLFILIGIFLINEYIHLSGMVNYKWKH